MSSKVLTECNNCWGTGGGGSYKHGTGPGDWEWRSHPRCKTCDGTGKVVISREEFEERQKTCRQCAVIHWNGERSPTGISGYGTRYAKECGCRIILKEIEDGGSCFIATAVYGDKNDWELPLLRRYRDYVLVMSLTGRIFIKTYYLISPPIARFIKKNIFLKNFIKIMVLTPVVGYIKRVHPSLNVKVK